MTGTAQRKRVQERLYYYNYSTLLLNTLAVVGVGAAGLSCIDPVNWECPFLRPPHIWGHICEIPHILGRPSSDFATAPLRISLYMRKISFSF
jgi:hypothetical protein